LEILEQRLGVFWNDRSEPVCLPDEMNAFTLQRIKNEIGDLYSCGSLDGAVVDSRSFGRDRVQTLGFGLAPDLDAFVKLGFLCGERLVLWDYLWGRALDQIDDGPDSRLHVAKTVCDLLLLKPIAQAGGLTILPHPMDWSSDIREYLSQLAASGSYSAANQGLVTALAVIQEIPVHPYTVFPDDPREWPEHPSGLGDHKHFSEEHYAFHRAVASIFDDVEFAYLRDIRAAAFFDIVSGQDGEGAVAGFYDALRQYLAPALQRLSPQEYEARVRQLRSELASKIARRNQDMIRVAATRAAGPIAATAAIGTVLNGQVLHEPGSKVALAIGAMSAALLRWLGGVLTRDGQSVVVQGFYRLREGPDA
jgi:hypothetical protein